MKISIIIGTYNAADTLERCLQSIISQTSNAWEILVSDGASDDDTLAILRRYSQHLAYLVSEADTGVYQAWNRVIPHAEGDWLIFLGADDQLASATVIEELVAALAARELTPANCDFVYGTTDLEDRGEIVERLGTLDTPRDHIPVDQEVTFAHTGLLHSRKVLDDLGLYDEGFQSAGDYEFLLRAALAKRGRLARLDITIATMAAGGMSNSASGRKRHYAEITQARRKHGLTSPMWLFRRRLKASALAVAAKLLNDQQMAKLANPYRKMRGKTERRSL